MAKVVLAGGSGFIGKILAAHFTGKGDDVIVLTRGANKTVKAVQFVQWDGKTTGPWVAQLEGSDVLINLTGKSVNCRYNEKNKAEILNSRLNATRVLGEALGMLSAPPAVWINTASATIYRHAEDRPQDEYDGEIGEGFSVDVCKAWEATFFERNIPGIRQIGLRVAIVLGKDGGVMPYYLNLVKFGLGGKHGNGRQYFSWIHEIDLTAIIDLLISRSDLEGIFNVSSPNPIPNFELMRVIRQVLHMPFGLPANKWMLTIGSYILRTEMELVMKSRRVIPTRLLRAGYVFKVKAIREAVELCSKS